MPYIVWLEWQRFYTSVEDESERPLIVLRDKNVLDANVAARKKGVRPGIDQRYAKMLALDCVVRQWDRETYEERQRAWLDICAEFSGVVEPIDQHIAALDLTSHPGRLDIVESLVRALVQAFRLPLHYGVASTKWIARLAAAQQNLEAHLEPAAFLAPLPVEDLLPVEEGHRQRLRFLGYTTIGKVAEVPLDVLQKQFGESALTIFQAAKGGCAQPVQALYPPDCLRECFYFESPVEDWTMVEEGLLALAEKAARRLEGRQSSQVELTVELEDGEPIVYSRSFTKPVFNLRTMVAVLKLLMPTTPDIGLIGPIGPISTPPCRVISLRVTLKELEPIREKQQRLIESTKRPTANSALHYIQNTFGDSSIKLASEIETPRRERVLKEWRHATGWH